mgnify:CR=1 FL=1
MEVRTISGDWGWRGTQAEASGCGRRGRYVDTRDGWVLNTDITQEATTATGAHAGTSGGPCYGNGTCNEGLSCTPQQRCEASALVAANGTDGGCFSFDLEKFPPAILELMTRVARIKGRGDKKDAEAIVAEFVDVDGEPKKLLGIITDPKAHVLYAPARDVAQGFKDTVLIAPLDLFKHNLIGCDQLEPLTMIDPFKRS